VCKRLIDLANEHGGPDNITVIAARFEGALGDASNGDEVGHKVFPLPDTGQVTAATPIASNDTPTAPIPAQRRPTKPLPMDAVVADDAPPAAAGGELSGLLARMSGPGPFVSARRRKTGMAIAVLLLLALILFAAWFLFNKAKSATAPAVDSTQTPSTRSA